MRKYFKPAPTKRNYQVVVNKNGKRFFDQLCPEGIYTENEMSKVETKVPGEWVEVPRNRIVFVFGLRQIRNL